DASAVCHPVGVPLVGVGWESVIAAASGVPPPPVATSPGLQYASWLCATVRTTTCVAPLVPSAPFCPGEPGLPSRPLNPFRPRWFQLTTNSARLPRVRQFCPPPMSRSAPVRLLTQPWNTPVLSGTP